jgi:hypothetical protein
MMHRSLIIFSLLFILTNSALSQGCSDAGVCSIQKAANDTTEEKKNALELGYTFALGLDGIQYHSGILRYARSISKTIRLYGAVNYNQASGSFGTLGRPGDVTLIGRYNRFATGKKNWRLYAGFKIPLSTANAKINGHPIPMDYQPSLGSIDALLAFDYRFKKIIVDAGLQIPVLQFNRNSYLTAFSPSQDYSSTNLLRRSPDALLRASYAIKVKQKLVIRPNAMIIYHLANDTYENIYGRREEINNSQGITVNASLAGQYKINESRSLQFNFATPLVVRKVRPDGLTRAFVATLSYHYNF